MKVFKANPTSPGQRFVVQLRNPELYKGRPHSSLVSKKLRSSGRNNAGRITVRHHGGGHKRHYRIIDYKRNKDKILGCIERIEYDPNRSANIALVSYKDGEKKYIISPQGLKKKDKIVSGENVSIKIGNCLPLRNIPLGTSVHNVELRPGKGAQLARSAGSYAQIVGRDEIYSILRFRSGESRKVLMTCRAVIGVVSNIEHNLKSIGKAGKKRWLGIRPTVRGVAMNPVDHPHGGGEVKLPEVDTLLLLGGVQTKGKKTRKNKRSDRLILKRRN